MFWKLNTETEIFTKYIDVDWFFLAMNTITIPYLFSIHLDTLSKQNSCKLSISFFPICSLSVSRDTVTHDAKFKLIPKYCLVHWQYKLSLWPFCTWQHSLENALLEKKWSGWSGLECNWIYGNVTEMLVCQLSYIEYTVSACRKSRDFLIVKRGSYKQIVTKSQLL